MAIDFDKINRSVDLEGLRKDVENASANFRIRPRLSISSLIR